ITADGCFRPQVVDIMRVNVDNVLERDQKLSELDDRADALQAGASFRSACILYVDWPNKNFVIIHSGVNPLEIIQFSMFLQSVLLLDHRSVILQQCRRISP
uniref:V-SNARE coiled-coil homology domain-containing protein n=1 Tax=Amphiprion percula TaxID=161767 RepID=A0A3P8SE61_AMPPE